MAGERIDPWLSRRRASAPPPKADVDLAAVATHPAVLSLSPRRRGEVLLAARLIGGALRSGGTIKNLSPLILASISESSSVRAPGEAPGALSRTAAARHMAFLQRQGLVPGVVPGVDEARPEEVRSTAVLVRLHPGERDHWHAAAQAAGHAKTATWVREVVEAAVVAQSVQPTSSTVKKPAKETANEAMESSAVRPPADQVPAALLTALARIGINVNQLVRRVNADARAGQEPLLLAKEVERLRLEFTRLRSELTRSGGGAVR